MQQKVLILTSSGGGGLIQTAVAKEQELKRLNPSLRSSTYDILKDWTWLGFGKLFIFFWNFAQRRGNVFLQELFRSIHPIADFLVSPSIFTHALVTLFREHPDRILDTQVMGTLALLKAIRIYNWKTNKNLHLEKILVDLPTPLSTHFFSPIKHLSSADRALFKLTTIEPMLSTGETAAHFWKTQCKLPLSSVFIEKPYVRAPFLHYQNRPRPKGPFTLKVASKSPDEASLILSCCSRGPIQYTSHGNILTFSIGEEDKMATLLLGSQPAETATLSYVDQFLSATSLSPSSKPIHLFVLCAEETLIASTVQKVKERKDYPAQASVIPLSFQEADVIASLFYRSDLTCTRSGGQTAMELMSVSKGKIWIHSERKSSNKPLSQEELLKGIPGWEAGNAQYLVEKNGAKIITPLLSKNQFLTDLLS